MARQPAEADIANICRRENPVSASMKIPPLYFARLSFGHDRTNFTECLGRAMRINCWSSILPAGLLITARRQSPPIFGAIGVPGERAQVLSVRQAPTPARGA